MRYGLELPCGGDGVTVGLLVRLGVEAQRAGWDGVFFEDYLVYHRGQDPSTFDPWLVMAVIAGRTSHLTLGTTVTGLLARDPVKLAREALTLRDLSDGRVVLGVGLGDPNDRGAAVNPLWDADRPRAAQMDERLDLLLALLAGRVPVWVGGSAEAGAVARRAARAAGVVPHKPAGPDRWSDFTSEEVATLAAAVEAHRTVTGSTASVDVAVGGRRRLASVEAERCAVDAAARGGATWWLELVHPGPDADMLESVRRGPVRATAGP